MWWSMNIFPGINFAANYGNRIIKCFMWYWIGSWVHRILYCNIWWNRIGCGFKSSIVQMLSYYWNLMLIHWFLINIPWSVKRLNGIISSTCLQVVRKERNWVKEQGEKERWRDVAIESNARIWALVNFSVSLKLLQNEKKCLKCEGKILIYSRWLYTIGLEGGRVPQWSSRQTCFLLS